MRPNTKWIPHLIAAGIAFTGGTAAADEGDSLVNVHVESNEPGATLARITSNAVAYGTGGNASAIGFDIVCTAPCDLGVRPNQLYVFQNVSGFGGRSDAFTIPATDPSITVRVDSRSQGAYVLGFVGVSLFGAGVVLGGSFAITGAATGNSSFTTDGLVTLGITAPLALFSLYEMLHNGTTVTVRPKRGHLALTASGVGGTF